MSVLAALVCVSLLSTIDVEASGAGRAFPVDSENYAIERFQTVNSRLEWDSTNFLVDLAGHYANCHYVGTTGTIKVDRLTPNGHTVTAVIDTTDGSRADSDAVNGYIRDVIDRWMRARSYETQIRGASVVGCSVRPACKGIVVISCLFSPGSDDNLLQAEEPPAPENIEVLPEQHALAFTREQYQVAEQQTGNKWDRSHMLENLSGYETSCEMLDAESWPFEKVQKISKDLDLRVSGLYGASENRGSTGNALVEILRKFKEIKYAKQLGCSIIPDCMRGSQMFVVVACVYQE